MERNKLEKLFSIVGISKHEAARLIGVHPMTVSKWTHGKGSPRVSDLQKLEKYGIDALGYLSGARGMNPYVIKETRSQKLIKEDLEKLN